MKPATSEIVARVQQCEAELRASAWFSRVRKQLRAFAFEALHVRCVAIGEPGHAQVQYQIAFLLLLLEEHGCTGSVWDPVLRKQDFTVFAHFGIAVTKQDPPAAVAEHCLWFAPHAPYFLEPELVEKVRGCVYIGNNLLLYRAGSVRDKRLVDDAKSNWTVVPLKEQKNLPWHEGFINTAIQQRKAPDA